MIGLVQEEHTNMVKLIVKTLKYSLFIGKYQIHHFPGKHCTPSNYLDSTPGLLGVPIIGKQKSHALQS